MTTEKHERRLLFRLKPPKDKKRVCPHRFCRYYKPLNEGKDDEGYCTARAFSVLTYK